MLSLVPCCITLFRHLLKAAYKSTFIRSLFVVHNRDRLIKSILLCFPLIVSYVGADAQVQYVNYVHNNWADSLQGAVAGCSADSASVGGGPCSWSDLQGSRQVSNAFFFFTDTYPIYRYYIFNWYFCRSGTHFTDTDDCNDSTPAPSPKPKPPPPCPACGDPINPADGTNMQWATDMVAMGQENSLSLKRYYYGNPLNPDDDLVRSFGLRWIQRYDSALRQEVDQQPNTPSGQCLKNTATGNTFCHYTKVAGIAAEPQTVSISRPNGGRLFFSRVGNNWLGDADINDKLTPNVDNKGVIASWTLVATSNDDTELYGSDGKLLSITSRNGAVQRLTYSSGTSNDTSVSRFPVNAPVCKHVQSGNAMAAGRLLCVTDNWGRQLQFEYDEYGRVTKAFDPDNQPYLYSYDGPSAGCPTVVTSNRACFAGNLTKVTYPDGKSITYFYNEAAKINGGLPCSGTNPIGSGYGSLINSLTGLVDENGVQYSSWTYDCQGRTTSNQLVGGVRRVDLNYGSTDPNGHSVTTVTYTLGKPTKSQQVSTKISYATILNVLKNIDIDQPCPDCDRVAHRTYDANGNVASTTDFKGVVTKYGYDLSRNLETSRTEAAGTALAKTTTTSWHEKFRLPLQINEPLLRTVFIYDSNGNVLTKTQQTTTDMSGSQGAAATVTGAPRVWRYTYNSVGQVLTVTGPRSDVVDVTTYAYDTQGNLTSLTNAAGHVTTMTNYDAHGHVGTITDPNGVVTNLTYAPRGWLLSRSTSADGVTETTTYTYDGVGQMTQVTLPDNSQVHYTYDDAHRLVRITDNVGNSINYILDNMGNRVQETVTDASGNLSRQVSRIYDTLNRLQQVTGVAQ